MSVVYVVSRAIDFYVLLIFIYVILSWFARSGPLFEVYRTLAMICEPFIGVFRRIVPVAGGLDFSPFVAILVLQVISSYLRRLG